jgi:hypothetical protein
MVEDGENDLVTVNMFSCSAGAGETNLWLNDDIERSGGWLVANNGWTKRPGKMEEGILCECHIDGCVCVGFESVRGSLGTSWRLSNLV